jgi:hypothetical protein
VNDTHDVTDEQGRRLPALSWLYVLHAVVGALIVAAQLVASGPITPLRFGLLAVGAAILLLSV